MLHPLRVGLDLHAVLGCARACGHEDARPLDLHHAYAAGVDGREVVGVAERGCVDPLRPACVEDRRPLRDPDHVPVDLDVDQPPRRVERHRLAHACAPSIVEEMESLHRRLYGGCRRLAQPADRGVAHHLRDLVDQGDLLLPGADLPALDQPMERFFLADGADAARDALAARLVAEEARDPQHDVHEVHRLVERHHDAGAQRVPARARVLERELDVQILRCDEPTCGTAEQDRLRRPLDPPREIEHRSQGRTGFHLVETRARHVSR